MTDYLKSRRTSTATEEWSSRSNRSPRDGQWKPSGLMVTKAKFWVYIFSDESFIIVQTDRLKRYLEINNQMEKKTFAANSNNPTRGYLLFPEDVSKLLSSELYDAPKEKS